MENHAEVQTEVEKAHIIEKLNRFFEVMDKDQVDFVYTFLCKMSSHSLSKGSLMDLAYEGKHSGKIDTALPLTWVRRVQEVYPELKTQFHAFSYVNRSHGEVINVAEDLIIKINEKLRS